MAETSPNNPQHAHIATQQLEQSNRTLDSPQRHQTPHQAIPPQIPPLHFNISLAPPIIIPGDDPFAIPPPVGEKKSWYIGSRALYFYWIISKKKNKILNERG